MSSLSHHGIKGQRWGVRRFQNEDGTRTAAGKKRYSVEAVDVASSRKAVKQIVKKFSETDNYYFWEHGGPDDDDVGYDPRESKIAKRFVIKEGEKIVGFIDAEKNSWDDHLNVVVGVDSKSRGKGYASALSKAMVDWYDSEEDKDNYSALEWIADRRNVASTKTANNTGFLKVNEGIFNDYYIHTKYADKEQRDYNNAYDKVHRENEAANKKLNTRFKETELGKKNRNVDLDISGMVKGKPSSLLNKEGTRRKISKWVLKQEDLAKPVSEAIKERDKAESVLRRKTEDKEYRVAKKREGKAKHTSIEGTMYIEGNALILGDSSYLEHHGVKGQRWGVRRFQNKDGTRTALGKKQLKAKRLSRNEKGIRDVYRSLSDEDFRTLGYSKEEAEQERKDDFLELGRRHTDYDQYNRVRYKDGKAVGYIAVTGYQTTVGRGKKIVNILAVDLAVHSEYRGNGYSVALGKDLVRWFDTYGSKEYDRMEWYAMSENIGSQKAAERSGFTRRSSKEAAKGWVKYRYDKKQQLKHTSIGGTMYIEGNALILGDSSYLEHHGIRGQRWGVRRFQNRDGSLTNAGRKRLGYATKGATQAVKKAFNAGVKTGAKAVKAAKAHHEKAEAKKIEKKKEKASKTRAGVYANKDLFTAKELKELNSKFEEQDKLTAARLKKGVEIAKSIGEVAKSAGEVGKAYEALTGHKLVPDIMALQNSGNNNNNNPPNTPPNGGNGNNNPPGPNNPPGNQPPGNNNNNNPPNTPPNGGNGNNNPPGPNNPPGNNGSGNKPNWTNTPPNLPTPPKGSGLTGLKKGLNLGKPKIGGKQGSDSDLQDQMESAKKQASKVMKDAKLQEYIDAYNRDQNSEKNKELTARGQKAIEILSKGGKFNSKASDSSPTPTSKATPSSNNLMAQIRAAQAKLEKPNKNETPEEHREAQQKVNQLERLAKTYNAQVNKPGADPAEVTEKLLKKNKDILDGIKHMDFRDDIYLEHHGVKGMKWGKHLMAGKGGDLYEGTALGAGGGGGPMTEEERKKAEALRKKKLEEAKKKAEEAAKEKEIEKKAKEIGISAKAYKRYSIDNNRLPGKHHYNKSQKLHGEASSSVAEAQAADRQAHMNRAKAASLNRKVNSSHMFDADGYHISQQRGDDRKEAKRLQKEAKQLDAKSKKALKKFYKKRYKADKERQKWQNSTSGKYHHLMRHYEIQNGVLFVDSFDGLTHHGIKGQRWGVRRFQNEDGSLTPKGRKHYEKKIEKLKRKQVSSDAIRGTLERQHPFAVTGAAVLGAVAAGMSVAATGGASVAMIAAGSAISAAVSSGLTHASYSASEAWEGRGTRIRKKKIAKYENMLKQSDMEEGMYHVENGTLFINAGEPYLEHHGVLGMKWGKHLRAGKGPADAPASAGGGAGEDDEKLKEMAKKAGMSVAEYKQKFASKIGGAASKVGEKVYDAAGGSHKKNAEGWRKMAQEESNAARASEKSSHENSARAASQDRKYGSGGDVYRRAADSDKENAETHRSNAKGRSERAASEQAAYEKSLAGKYDKMKADRARKKSARQDKAFSGTSPKEKKRVARKDQYLALPEQKKRSRVYDNKDAETRRARAERLTRDSEIFNRAAEESKRKQNSALNKGNKHEAEVHGKDAQFAQNWAEEGRRGAKDWRTGRRTGKPVLRTDSLDQVKKQHDKTLSGKIDKARHTIQRGKQKVYNAAGRYDEFKEKRKKKKAKHFDDTNAIYTEGTRLVVNSKWG